MSPNLSSAVHSFIYQDPHKLSSQPDSDRNLPPTSAWKLPSTVHIKTAPLYRHWVSVHAVRPRSRSRGIALLFLDHGSNGSASRPGHSLPQERPGTHCSGGRVGPRVGLKSWGKSRPHRDSIPGSSSPQPVAIPTRLPGPHHAYRSTYMYMFFTRTGTAKSV